MQFVIDSFKEPGDIFDPSQFRVGTLILRHQERLVTYEPPPDPIDFEALAGVPLPPRGQHENLVISNEDKSLRYESRREWGVVVKASRGVLGLAAVPEMYFENHGSGVFVPGSYLVSARIAPLVIGEIEHYKRAKKPRHESVARTNFVEVRTHGLPERQRQLGSGWLRRLGLAGDA